MVSYVLLWCGLIKDLCEVGYVADSLAIVGPVHLQG